MKFSLNTVEAKRYEEWFDFHKDHCGKTVDKGTGKSREGSLGPVFPSIRYCFTPTGIGNAVVIECSCGRSVDVTDLDNA